MKLIPKLFSFFRQNLPKIRWIILTLFVVSCVYLFICIPKYNERFSNHTWDDLVIVVFQVAKGQLSDIHGPKDSLFFQLSRLILPLCLAWAVIEAFVRIFIHFFAWFAISRWFNGHVIVFGLGEKGFSLAKELLKRKHIVVAIDKNAANPYLAQIECGHGFTLVGDATDINFLKTLGLHRAAAFYAMTGDDTVNIECAVKLKEYFQQYKISFWSHFWNYLCGFKNTTFSARIQVHDSVLRRLAWEDGGPFSHASINNNTVPSWVCYPFSAYDQAAKMIVEKFSPDIAEGKTKKYHVVIVGFGWFGERVALQVIRMCKTPKSLGHELVIHVIDNQADLNRERFYQRYPAVNTKNTNDPRYGSYAPLANLNFIPGDIQQMDEAAIRKEIPEIDESTVIYVCLADELLGAEAAMSLARITRDSGTRIVFALPETERLSKKMQQAFEKYNISMFLPLSTSCLLAHNEKQLGETMDNMGKAVLRAYYDSPNVVALEKTWAESAEWSRESSRQSASHVFFKLRMVGIDYKDFETIMAKDIKEKFGQHLEMLAEVEHDRWVTERLLDGWIYDGDKKDTTKRLHRDIQPFAALNKGTQDIDFAVNEIIPNVVEIWQKARKAP